MRLLFFGPFQATGLDNEPALTRVASGLDYQDFRHLLNDCRSHKQGKMCLWLPLSEAKQESLLEFLSVYEGDILLLSPTIDFTLRPALADLFVCHWQDAVVVKADETLAAVERELNTDCLHRRALGVWLRRRGQGIRREDRLFARALDSLSTQAAPADTEVVE